MYVIFFFLINLFCDCNFSTNVNAEIKYSDVIFEAKLNDIDNLNYNAKVSKEFKGINKSEYTISIGILDCSYFHFDTINTFLIYGNFNSDSTIYVSFCSRTTLANKSYDYDFLNSKDSTFNLGDLAANFISQKSGYSKERISEVELIVGYDWINEKLFENYDTEDPHREKVKLLGEKSFYHIHPYILNIQIIELTEQELERFDKTHIEKLSKGILVLSILDQNINREVIVNSLTTII